MIKYTPKDKSINIISTDKQLIVEVIDEGPGIDPVDQTRIFNRFYRADASRNKDKVDGYGLGLSFAQQIVTLHHGTLSVQSEVGQGSTFTVTLPKV